MATEMSVPDSVGGPSRRGVAIHSNSHMMRTLEVAAGIGWSIVFVVIGLRYELQLYGDGSMFSYSVAVQDAWAFHWHNISGRLFVYLVTYVPAETYVELTGDAGGGILVYGFLFFAAQLLGLIATLAVDRSGDRAIFAGACASTACFCPLVFGFPTEMWMAHAVFWPALAVCHYAPHGIGGIVAVFAVLLALVFTHEGALILAAAILATLLLRGLRDTVFLRAAGAFLVVISIWALLKATFPPDAYDAPVMARAALHFFDVNILTSNVVLLLLATLVSYGIAVLTLRRLSPTRAYLYAATIVAITLTVYWLRFDHALHTDNRYYLRTLLLIGTGVLGPLAAVYALAGEDRPTVPVLFLHRLRATLAPVATAQAMTGAILLVMLVHAVEIAKFIRAWTNYKGAVQALAIGTASDPALGDARFVSSDRIGSNLNRLSWFSTTQFLSVLVAPGFAPARLVVDPKANYFWLSCETATANQTADRAVPDESRRLVRVHACLHR